MTVSSDPVAASGGGLAGAGTPIMIDPSGDPEDVDASLRVSSASRSVEILLRVDGHGFVGLSPAFRPGEARRLAAVSDPDSDSGSVAAAAALTCQVSIAVGAERTRWSQVAADAVVRRLPGGPTRLRVSARGDEPTPWAHAVVEVDPEEFAEAVRAAADDSDGGESDE